MKQRAHYVQTKRHVNLPSWEGFLEHSNRVVLQLRSVLKPGRRLEIARSMIEQSGDERILFVDAGECSKSHMNVCASNMLDRYASGNFIDGDQTGNFDPEADVVVVITYYHNDRMKFEIRRYRFQQFEQ